jgi:hypothetical protein
MAGEPPPDIDHVVADREEADAYDEVTGLYWDAVVDITSTPSYARGALEVSYVGSRGDSLIRPVDINRPQPADVVRLGGENVARPYAGSIRRTGRYGDGRLVRTRQNLVSRSQLRAA